MCGIAGVVGGPSDQVVERLERMSSALRHRGPDDSGLLADARGGLAIRRLAIVGIQNGRQPIASEDENHAIVGNGEIYNAPELRRELEARGHRFRTDSDIETALHLYEDGGPAAFHRLNGMFALAIREQSTGNVLLVRDRLGIKPLYYALTPHGALFASEIPALDRAILPQDAFVAETDPAAVGQYLRLGYLPGPSTFHRRIRQLPAGHWGWLSATDIRPEPWWELPSYRPEERALEEWASELGALIADSVRLRTLGDVPAGAFLSGGLDSGLLVAILATLSPEPVKVFTLGFDDPTLDEVADAKRVAERCGCDHEIDVLSIPEMSELEAIFTAHGEPFADVSLLATHRVARLASAHVKFVITGDGGDELCAGYPWLLQEFRWRRLPAPVRAAAKVFGPLLRRGRGSRRADGWGRALRAAADIASTSALSFIRRRSLCGPALFPKLLHPRILEAAPQTHPLEHYGEGWRGSDLEFALDLDRRFYLRDDILPKVDRATMHYSLEARVPLLDHRLLELAARIPVTVHLGPRGHGKAVLRRVVQDLLPPELLSRRKRGFGIPVDSWLRGPLFGDLEARLLDRAFRDAELVNERWVRRLLAEHASRSANHGHLLWGLLSLAVWTTSGATDRGLTPKMLPRQPA